MRHRTDADAGQDGTPRRRERIEGPSSDRDAPDRSATDDWRPRRSGRGLPAGADPTARADLDHSQTARAGHVDRRATLRSPAEARTRGGRADLTADPAKGTLVEHVADPTLARDEDPAARYEDCLLYTSDAADEEDSVD